jgi:hypothetical protein
LQLLTLACCTGAPQKVGAHAMPAVCTCDQNAIGYFLFEKLEVLLCMPNMI